MMNILKDISTMTIESLDAIDYKDFLELNGLSPFSKTNSTSFSLISQKPKISL